MSGNRRLSIEDDGNFNQVDDSVKEGFGRLRLFTTKDGQRYLIAKNPNLTGLSIQEAKAMDSVLGYLPARVSQAAAHHTDLNSNATSGPFFTEIINNKGSPLYFQYSTASLQNLITQLQSQKTRLPDRELLALLGFLVQTGRGMESGLNWHSFVNPSTLLLSPTGLQLVHPCLSDHHCEDLRSTASRIASSPDWQPSYFGDKQARLSISQSSQVLKQTCVEHSKRLSGQIDQSIATVLGAAAGKDGADAYLDRDGVVDDEAVREDIEKLRGDVDKDILWLAEEALLVQEQNSFTGVEKLIAVRSGFNNKIAASMYSSPLTNPNASQDNSIVSKEISKLVPGMSIDKVQLADGSGMWNGNNLNRPTEGAKGSGEWAGNYQDLNQAPVKGSGTWGGPGNQIFANQAGESNAYQTLQQTPNGEQTQTNNALLGHVYDSTLNMANRQSQKTSLQLQHSQNQSNLNQQSKPTQYWNEYNAGQAIGQIPSLSNQQAQPQGSTGMSQGNLQALDQNSQQASPSLGYWATEATGNYMNQQPLGSQQPAGSSINTNFWTPQNASQSIGQMAQFNQNTATSSNQQEYWTPERFGATVGGAINNQQQATTQQPSNQQGQKVPATPQGLPQLTADELAVANQVFYGVLGGTSVQQDALGNTILGIKRPIQQHPQVPQYPPIGQQYVPAQEPSKIPQTSPVQQGQALSANYDPKVTQQQSSFNNLQLSASTGTSGQQTLPNLQQYQQPGITITPRKQEGKKTDDQAVSEMVGYMQFLETKVAALEQQLTSQKALQQGAPSQPMQQTPQKQQDEIFTPIQFHQDSQNIQDGQNAKNIRKSIASATKNISTLIEPMTLNQTNQTNSSFNVPAGSQTQQKGQKTEVNQVNSNNIQSQTSTAQNINNNFSIPKTALKQNGRTKQNSQAVQRPGLTGGNKVSFNGQTGSQASHTNRLQTENMSHIVENRPYVYNESGQKVYIGESIAFGHLPAQQVTLGHSPAQQTIASHSLIQSRPLSARPLPSMPTQSYLGPVSGQVRSKAQIGALSYSSRTPATVEYYGQNTPIKHIDAPIRRKAPSRAQAQFSYPEVLVEQSIIHQAPSHFSKRPPPVTAYGIHKVGTSDYHHTTVPQGILSDGLTTWSHARYPTSTTPIYL